MYVCLSTQFDIELNHIWPDDPRRTERTTRIQESKILLILKIILQYMYYSNKMKKCQLQSTIQIFGTYIRKLCKNFNKIIWL